eukprot:365891-Chlamydomonas_euryale.AAC.1
MLPHFVHTFVHTLSTRLSTPERDEVLVPERVHPAARHVWVRALTHVDVRNAVDAVEHQHACVVEVLGGRLGRG